MSLKFVFFIWGLLSIITLSSVLAVGDQDIGNANDYIDKVLENLRKEPEITKPLDPLDVSEEVNEKSFQLKNIKVRGLSNLYRQGNSSLSKNGKNFNLTVEVAVRNLTVTMDYRAKTIFFSINGTALVTVDHVYIKVDITSVNGTATVTYLKVTNLGPYRVTKATGGTVFLNCLIKIIANKAAQKSKETIINALENDGKNALNEVLKEFKLPTTY